MDSVLDKAALLVCENRQCRVAMFRPGDAGPRCPACYGEAAVEMRRVEM